MRWSHLLFLTPALLLANPSGMEVVSGVASLERAAHELRVTVGDRAELNWQNFSIGPSETTRFIQPSAESYVLNRVVGGGPSTIHGLLEANGRLLLINPAGIVVGPRGTIRTAGFIASTLDVLNFDPKEMHFSGRGGEVVNCGQIEVAGSEVVLLGEVVKNYGTIRANEVRLGAGREIVLLSAGEQRLIIQPSLGDSIDGAAIDQQGRIEAIQAELRTGSNLYALAINHGGYIDALGMAEVEGRIFLVAEGGRIEATGNLVAPGGTVHLLSDEILLAGEATIDVSGVSGGGTALIGGDYHGANPDIPTASYLVVEEGVSIHADALEKGDGGKAILWGKNVCGCFGTVTAQGGPQGGDGGLIEVSGHGWYSIAGAPLSTFAPLGRNGTLSFDPVNVTISNNPNAGIATYPPRKYIFDGTAASWNVNATDLEGYLGANSIEVNTSLISGPDPGLAGNIDVNANVVWNTNSVLTLYADATLSINNGAIIENTASPPEPDVAIYLYADTLNVGGPGQTGASAVVAENKSIVVNAGTINVTGSTTSGSLTRINTVNQGNITINATGDLNITTPSVGSAQIKAENDNTLVVGGTINVAGGPSAAQAELNATSGTLNATAQAIHVTSGSFAGSLAHLGILTEGEVVLTTTADLTVLSPDLGTAQVVSMGNMTLNIGNGLTVHADGSGSTAEIEAMSGRIAATLQAGNFVVSGGTDASATAQTQAKITADGMTLSLPAGDHGVFGGSVGSASVATGGDLSITSTQPSANFSVIAGRSATGLTSAASLETTGSGNLALDVATLTVQGNLPFSGSGLSQAFVQANSGSISVVLGEMLTVQPAVAGGELSTIQTTGGGDISITGNRFDAVIGGVSGDGSRILTAGGGSIQFGSLSAPAGSVTISSLPAATASAPRSGLVVGGVEGDIALVATGTLSMVAGDNPTGLNGDAGLFVTGGMGDISVIAGNIVIQGGAGTGPAVAGITTTQGDIDIIGLGSLAATGSTVSAGSNESQIAALGGGNISGAFFGTIGLTGGLGDARIYTTSGNIALIGGAVDLSGSTAYIQSDGGGAMNIRARNNVTLSDGAFFSLVGPQGLTALAGIDFTVADNSFVQVTAGGSMALVCDNQFPSPPFVGPGEFNLSPTSQLNAPGGRVLLYTARRLQNSIASGQTINGSTFVPGPIFVNSDTEQWSVYYPGGTPPMGAFKIYYKSVPVPISNYYQNVAAIVGEFFDQMNWFVDAVDQPTFPYRYPISLFEITSR